MNYKIGDKVVLDYYDGPTQRVYGTVVGKYNQRLPQCYLVQQDNGQTREWHYTRFVLTEIIESPLARVMREDDN